MPETPNPEAVTLFALVVNRYGGRLTTEQLDEIKKMVEGQVEMARALRAVRLGNADEPFQAFTAYRGDPTPHPPLSPEGRGM
ncbi:MAG TPA: hypothetical protein VGT00_18375 [Methylomirabilota bacterium]|jgi:hypothetical protein|nr:hypothetical protein [Methylomirabilota bacterium]